MKILYIEDSPDHVITIERIAHYLGHEVVVALTGEQGCMLIKDNPDLVLIDINLPDKNGLDLTRQFRAEQYTMPIIAVSGDMLRYNVQQALQAGCTEFIAKPYAIETIKDLFTRLGR